MKALIFPSSQCSLSSHLKNLFQEESAAQLLDNVPVVEGWRNSWKKKVKYVLSVVREVGRLESDRLGAEMVLAVFVEADSLLPEGIMHAGSMAAIFFKSNSQKEM